MRAPRSPAIAAPPDRDPRNRSALRILVPAVLILLVTGAAFLTLAETGDQRAAAVVGGGGGGMLALWAVIDGARRALGRSTFLGVGRGLDRLFGLIQVCAAIGSAVTLLPNVIALLGALGRIASGLR